MAFKSDRQRRAVMAKLRSGPSQSLPRGFKRVKVTKSKSDVVKSLQKISSQSKKEILKLKSVRTRAQLKEWIKKHPKAAKEIKFAGGLVILGVGGAAGIAAAAALPVATLFTVGALEVIAINELRKRFKKKQ